MKKLISIFSILLLLVVTVIAQPETKSFSTDPEAFFKELSDYLNATKRSDCKEAVDNFEALMKGGKITSDNMKTVIATANVLRGRNLTAYPYFQNYLATINLAVQNKDQIWLKSWFEILNNIIVNQRLGDNKRYIEFLDFTNDYVTKNALNSNNYKTWTCNPPNYELVIQDGLPFVRVGQTTLIGYVSGDSVIIEGTSGIYNVFEHTWQGSKGKVDFGRAGMDVNSVYVNLRNYDIDMSKSEYTADTVDLTFSLFFSKPILGSFMDKLITNNDEDRSTYPRFTSFDDEIRIDQLTENVAYKGAFNLFGSKIYGEGKNGKKAELIFYLSDGKTKALVARGKDITIRKPVELNFRDAEISIYFGTDSIYHPSVMLNFKIPTRAVTVSRGKDGIAAAKFYDSYHQTEIEADAITWMLDSKTIDFKMEEGAGKKLAVVNSMNFYSPNLMKKIQGTSDVNPIGQLYLYLNKNKIDEIDAESFAKIIGPRLTYVQVLPLIYQMAEEGFILFDPFTKNITVLPKNELYVKAYAKKTDYDAFRFGSLSQNLEKPIGQINLINYDIDFAGVKQVPLSDTARTVIFPTNDSLKLKKDRDIQFDGMIMSSRLDIFGHANYFNYAGFKIDLPQADSIILNIPAPGDKVDNYGDLILTPMNSKIEKLVGVLDIDHPSNKSGNSPLKQFPMLHSKENSYVFYDQKRILNGVYPREGFYFMNDPFDMDSLQYFDANAMFFDGEMHTSGIFNPFREQIRKQSDYSLGYVSKAPMSRGFDAYVNQGAAKGSFKGQLTLNLDGLRGLGQINYLSSTLAAKDIIFYPDSLQTIADQFDIAFKQGDVNTPKTHAEENRIEWRPYQDEMAIKRGKDAFSIYDDKTTFDGDLLLGKKGLYGNGKLEFDEASLTSSKMALRSEDLEADTANLQIKSIEGDKVTFNTPNVQAKVDFKTRTGKFVSNEKDIPTDFANNQYKTTINEFDWDIDNKILDFKAPKGSGGSYFISTHPDQGELKFLAKRAVFDMKTSIIDVSGIPEIRVADSRVIPDSGKATIEPEAKLRTFNNAKIEGDTTKGYQKIKNVTCDITGINKISGTGTYVYKSEDGAEHEFDITELGVNSETVGEKKEIETQYHLYAKGNVKEGSGFKLHKDVSFYGDVDFETRDKDINFNGFAQIDFKNPNVDKTWFGIKQRVNANNWYFEFDKPRSSDGGKVFTGIALSKLDTTGGIYTAIMNAKEASSDKIVFDASGIIVKDNSGQYIFGDSAKIYGTAKVGNVFKYNDNTGKVTAEGKIDFGRDFGGLNIVAAGDIDNDINNKTYKFDLTLGIGLDFDKNIMEKIAFYLLEDNFDNPDIDYSSDKFNKQIAELIDPKDEKKMYEEFEKTGFIGRVKSFDQALVLTNTRFIYDTENRAYRSIGPIGISLYGEKGVHKQVEGYIEFDASKTSGAMSIYLKTSLGDWIYFSYKSSNVQILSSYEDINEMVATVAPEKRKITRDDGKFYVYSIGSTTKMKSFVEEMKEFSDKNK